jgi:hypothetical protein
MKHHSQVFIALFVLFILINIYPLQEGYKNSCKDISDCLMCINNKIGNDYCYWDSVYNKCDIYTNTMNLATSCSKKKDNVDNLDISNNVKIQNNSEYDHKWLNSENGSSTEYKFSNNYKFKNPFQDISNNNINKPDFKLHDYYWPLS